MKKKKIVIDHYDQRVMLESIAAYKQRDIKVHVYLKSGNQIELQWPTRADTTIAVRKIDKYFDEI